MRFLAIAVVVVMLSAVASAQCVNGNCQPQQQGQNLRVLMPEIQWQPSVQYQQHDLNIAPYRQSINLGQRSGYQAQQMPSPRHVGYRWGFFGRRIVPVWGW